MESEKCSTSCLKNCKLPDLFMNVLKTNASKRMSLENEQQRGRDHIDKDGDTVPICKEHSSQPDVTEDNDEEQLHIIFTRVTAEKIFASLARIKAYYALLQFALFPYKAILVAHSDEVIVKEFVNLFSLLRSFHGKRQLDFPVEEFSLAMSRQSSACITSYKVIVNKLKLRTRSKDSQISLLREELEKKTDLNKVLMRTAGCSGSVSFTEEEVFEQSRIMRLSYFIRELHHTVRSIRHFVKLMANRMRFAGWDLDVAAEALQPGLRYWGQNDICFAFEAFICSEMFEGFQLPSFCLSKEALPHPKLWRRYFTQKYLELKSMKPGGDYLSNNPDSLLAAFFRSRYQRVINPKMELSFFGNMNFRNHIKLGGFPEAPFVDSFLEMAKRVLRLQYLALSMDPNASIFQAPRGSQFSEIYMESVHQDPFLSSYNYSGAAPRVSFTVVPGFKLCQTIIQCQVYFSQPPETLICPSSNFLRFLMR